jgi:hypothetical protein
MFSGVRAVPNIVFLHSGKDPHQPSLMVRSFRKHNPEFRIVQVSDADSPAVNGVDEVVRHANTERQLMLLRMRCFAAMPVDEPTWFFDTDMLCVRPLELAVPDTGVAVCQREFAREAIFNHQFGGMDLSEYAGRALGWVYPYVACATYVHKSEFWRDCLAELEGLDPKFHHWYGDQEAIRNVVKSQRHDVQMLRESLYACLPEHSSPLPPFVFHYKGQRKPLMLERAAQEGLL